MRLVGGVNYRDGGRGLLQNFGDLLSYHTASHARRAIFIFSACFKMIYSRVSSWYEEMEEVRDTYRPAQGLGATTSWKTISCRGRVKDYMETDRKKVKLDSLDLTDLVWAFLCTLYC